MLNAFPKRQKWIKWPVAQSLNATRQKPKRETIGERCMAEPKIQITNAICTANNEQFGSNSKTQNEECVLKIKNLRRDLAFEKGGRCGRFECTFKLKHSIKQCVSYTLARIISEKELFSGSTKQCPATHSFQPIWGPVSILISFFHSALVFSNRIFSLQSRVMACNVMSMCLNVCLKMVQLVAQTSR